MLNENSKVLLPDLKNRSDVGMEVAFSDNEELKDTIRVTIGKEEAIVKIKDLYGFMFVIANAEQQEQLLPVRSVTVRKIRKQHRIKVLKHVYPGEHVVANCETNVPVEIFEGMKSMMGSRIEHKSARIPIIRAK
jgi:hypothetical protein